MNSSGITLIQAILCGLWYYYIDLGMPNPQTAFYTFYRPLVTGAVIGLILGDFKTGCIVGAQINLVFIGFLSVGGAQSQDPAFAGVLGAAFAIAAKLDPLVAVALAVPLSLLANFLYVFQMSVQNQFWVQLSKKHIQNGDRKKLFLTNVLFPQLTQCVMHTGAIVLILMLGVDAVAGLMNNLPQWIMNALSTVGALLPALGIAINLSVVAKRRTLPFFFLGFLLTMYLGLDLIVVSIVALLIALLLLYRELDEKGMTLDFGFGEEGDKNDERAIKLTKKQVRAAWLRYILQVHSAYQYEMLQGVSFAESMGYTLNILYKDDHKKFTEEWQKHLQFYNTEPNFGSMIFGITTAMEEDRANGMDVSVESIQMVKTSLMGPIAGVGDTVIQGALCPIFCGIAINLTMGGSYYAPFVYAFGMTIALWFLARALNDMGYRLGRRAVEVLLGNGVLNMVVNAMGIIGCMVLGGLAAQFVTVNTPLVFTTIAAQTADETAQVFSLQTDLFDVLLKGLLPLGFTMLTYRLIKKQWSTNKVLVLLLAIGLVFGALGILSA